MRFVAWLIPLALVPQEGPEARERRVRQAIRWFADRDAEVSQSGRAELVALGREAVPGIEKRLSEMGALPLANLLREIDRNAPSGEPYALPAEEDLAVQKADKEVADRYVRLKYAEAMAWAKKGNVQKGFDQASALLALEPHHAIGDKVKQLRRYCENMITQTSLLEAKVLQEKTSFAAGEPVTLTLRLKNIFKNAMTLKYDGAAGRPAEGMAVIEIEASVSAMAGESTSSNRHLELSFEGEIPLAPGAQWERRFQVDTALGLPDEVEVQTIVVNVWTQPGKIDADGVNLTRRVQFEPAVLKIVPKRYAHLIENPLGSLSKTIETDRPAQETWVCAQILAPEERRRGAEVLVRAMEKAENPNYRPALARMLTELTGEKFGPDPKKWSDWLAKLGPEKKKK